MDDVAAPILPIGQPMRKAHPFTVFHPGWLFLVAGIAIIACSILIPAQRDLEDARWARDRAVQAQAHREARLDNYRSYLQALDQRQPSLVLALAESQLNEIPADRNPIEGLTETPRAEASVFGALEPPPLRDPPHRHVDSVLVRLTGNSTTRLWMIAGGMVCLLIGLLPASRAKGEVPDPED